MEIAGRAGRRAPHREAGGRDGRRSATWSRASRTATARRRGAARGRRRATAPPPPSARAAARAPRRRRRRRRLRRPQPAPRPRGASRVGPLSPAVRRLVDEHGLDPAAIPASGKGGRLTKGDVLAHLERRASRAPTVAAPPRRRRRRAPRAAPRRRRAAAARARRRVPMSRIRKRIAERLVAGAAHRRDPHHLQRDRHERRDGAPRAQHKERFQKKHGVGLGFMSFFARACIAALARFPASTPRSAATTSSTSTSSTSASRSGPSAGSSCRSCATPTGMSFAEHRARDRAPRRAGARRQAHARRPRRRHLHDLQRRRLRLAALDADPEPAAERHPRHAQDREAAGRGRRPDRRSGR